MIPKQSSASAVETKYYGPNKINSTASRGRNLRKAPYRRPSVPIMQSVSPKLSSIQTPAHVLYQQQMYANPSSASNLFPVPFSLLQGPQPAPLGLPSPFRIELQPYAQQQISSISRMTIQSPHPYQQRVTLTGHPPRYQFPMMQPYIQPPQPLISMPVAHSQHGSYIPSQMQIDQRPPQMPSMRGRPSSRGRGGGGRARVRGPERNRNRSRGNNSSHGSSIRGRGGSSSSLSTYNLRSTPTIGRSPPSCSSSVHLPQDAPDTPPHRPWIVDTEVDMTADDSIANGYGSMSSIVAHRPSFLRSMSAIVENIMQPTQLVQPSAHCVVVASATVSSDGQLLMAIASEPPSETKKKTRVKQNDLERLIAPSPSPSPPPATEITTPSHSEMPPTETCTRLAKPHSNSSLLRQIAMQQNQINSLLLENQRLQDQLRHSSG